MLIFNPRAFASSAYTESGMRIPLVLTCGPLFRWAGTTSGGSLGLPKFFGTQAEKIATALAKIKWAVPYILLAPCQNLGLPYLK